MIHETKSVQISQKQDEHNIYAIMKKQCALPVISTMAWAHCFHDSIDTLRDRIRIYRQHIRQPQHEKLKLEKHLRTCGKGNFTIFPFLQLRSNNTDLRREHKDCFIKKYKTKLNSL